MSLPAAVRPTPIPPRGDGGREPARRPSDIGPLTPHLYAPSVQRPLRAKLHHLSTDTRVVPHRHPWGQLALSRTGVVRLTVESGSFIVPPSRALWIPPEVEHALTVLEDAALSTVYFLQPRARFGPQLPKAQDAAWRQCRVLEVSNLLRSLVLELDVQPDGAGPPLSASQMQREKLISALVQDELRRARPVRLGVDLPSDKRLLSLCKAVLDDPTRHTTLDGWARDAGASTRTLARLFRSELGTSFVQWRQQVLLARALGLAAHKRPMASIAAELGYASASAFSAMVKRSVGAPPSRFFA